MCCVCVCVCVCVCARVLRCVVTPAQQPAGNSLLSIAHARRQRLRSSSHSTDAHRCRRVRPAPGRSLACRLCTFLRACRGSVCRTSCCRQEKHAGPPCAPPYPLPPQHRPRQRTQILPSRGRCAAAGAVPRAVGGGAGAHGDAVAWRPRPLRDFFPGRAHGVGSRF